MAIKAFDVENATTDKLTEFIRLRCMLTLDEISCRYLTDDLKRKLVRATIEAGHADEAAIGWDKIDNPLVISLEERETASQLSNFVKNQRKLKKLKGKSLENSNN